MQYDIWRQIFNETREAFGFPPFSFSCNLPSISMDITDPVDSGIRTPWGSTLSQEFFQEHCSISGHSTKWEDYRKDQNKVGDGKADMIFTKGAHEITFIWIRYDSTYMSNSDTLYITGFCSHSFSYSGNFLTALLVCRKLNRTKPCKCHESYKWVIWRNFKLCESRSCINSDHLP